MQQWHKFTPNAWSAHLQSCGCSGHLEKVAHPSVYPWGFVTANKYASAAEGTGQASTLTDSHPGALSWVTYYLKFTIIVESNPYNCWKYDLIVFFSWILLYILWKKILNIHGNELAFQSWYEVDSVQADPWSTLLGLNFVYHTAPGYNV